MKIITDERYGQHRAYITSLAVIWIPGTHGPTAAICVSIEGGPAWRAFDDNDATCHHYNFQPDPGALRPGEWCWPVTQPPVTAESVREVCRRSGAGLSTAKTALTMSRGEIDGAVELCGGCAAFFGRCCYLGCQEVATGRDAQAREWCDAHVPKGVEVWIPTRA